MTDIEADSELLSWARPDESLFDDRRRGAYRRNVAAVTSVKKGMTVRDAARLHGINRGTLSSIIRMVDELAPDGRAWGFRACVPWRRRSLGVSVRCVEVPAGPGPHALVRLLHALQAVSTLVEKYSGPLPRRNRPADAFEKFFDKFKELLVQAGASGKFPLNTPDQGRRALMRHLLVQRHRTLNGNLLQPEADAPQAHRLADLIALAPLDQVEVDGHKTDVNWRLQAPGPDGTIVMVDVPCIWLLVMVDSVSFAVYAWHLVVGRKYSQHDLLELHARALTPWAPRALVSPDMSYDVQAWMPSSGLASNEILRPACDSMDNDSAHTSKLSTESLSSFQRGIVNLGPAGIPERRPHIEAFFKMIEERVYRRLAGGFRPAGAMTDDATRANALNPNDYPLDLIALEDLTDVVVSRYNVTAHGGLQGRSPREVHEGYLRSRPWLTRLSQTPEDVRALRTLRKKVCIRGSQKDRVLPHVHWENAIYRSPRLKGRWDLIGKSYMARLLSTDLREMALYDLDTGELVVVLRALSPWHRSPHDIYVRRRAKAWRDRGLLKYENADDAVEAYHAYVRDHAWRNPGAAEGLARPRPSMPESSNKPATLPTAGNPLAGLVPRTGPVSFVRPKRNL